MEEIWGEVHEVDRVMCPKARSTRFGGIFSTAGARQRNREKFKSNHEKKGGEKSEKGKFGKF